MIQNTKVEDLTFVCYMPSPGEIKMIVSPSFARADAIARKISKLYPTSLFKGGNLVCEGEEE